MIEGLEKFKETFREYKDCYTIIGGAACDILMSHENLDFRATKDIDMIVILEDNFKDFTKVFWQYIKEAKYKCGWKNENNTHFYRFTNPKPGYPVMIELFSRKLDDSFQVEHNIIPIHIDNDTYSLSAILLNDDFYNFMLEGRKTVDDISLLSEEYLIPFKMYAWLDLTEKRKNGEFVKSTDLKKHKYDVFRLLQLVNIGKIIKTNGLVKESIEKFIVAMNQEELHLEQLKLPFSKQEGIDMLIKLYDIKNRNQL